MRRKVITTADGSTTIQLEDWNEQYHSKHGALQEAYHVFIKHGLRLCQSSDVSILEMGFGTGLNAFITYLEAERFGIHIDYVGVEAYPVEQEELKQLNYVDALDAKAHQHVFDQLHGCEWAKRIEISNQFELTKLQMDFIDIQFGNMFNLIYFDAFGPRVQPELWTEAIFGKMYAALTEGGVLATYSAKGSVRRAMQSVGFKVERLPGPPGKREMLVGKKQTKS